MRKPILSMFLIAFLLAYMIGVTVPAQARQIVSGEIVYNTRPIDGVLRDQLDAWLAATPPAPLDYWIVTYTKYDGLKWYVSLVGQEIYDLEKDWSFEDGDAVWMGTVTVLDDGTVSMYSTSPQTRLNTPHLAMPALGPGGGSYVSLPWQNGKTMMYGSRAIHGEGEYGTSGMFAIDWVGGSDLGSGVASDDVYASAGGEIDYICEDGTSVAVRLEGSDDYFLYAHLAANGNLEMGHSFSSRGNLGSLVHGDFQDDCGWAEQGPDHYHVHWMFVPDDGFFRAGDCILDFDTTKWTCGTVEYGTGEYVRNGGTGNGDGDDDPQTDNDDVSFFDFTVAGFVVMFEESIIKLLPSHEAFEYTQTLMNTVGLTIRIARVLVYGNVNLGPIIAVIIAGIGFKILFGIAWLIAFVFKAWKSLVPILGA